MIIFHHDKPIELNTPEEFERFARDFRIIHAAGGIVKNDKQEILMIYRWEKWDFPKGKVEAGEEFADAAVREVEEETGITGITIENALPSTFHTYELRGEPILKETHWYSMRAPVQPLIPQTSEDITQAVWVPIGEVSMKLDNSYPSLVNLWKMV